MHFIILDVNYYFVYIDKWKQNSDIFDYLIFVPKMMYNINQYRVVSGIIILEKSN